MIHKLILISFFIPTILGNPFLYAKTTKDSSVNNHADQNPNLNKPESIESHTANKESDSSTDQILEIDRNTLGINLFFEIYGMIVNFGTSSNNDNVKTTKVSSEFIGKSYTLKAPYFIQLNLPKGERAHSASVFVAEGEFVPFRNNCGNCLDSKRLEKPIRLHYVPKGSKITVVDAFVLGYNFIKTNPDRVYLIIQDEAGVRAEITTLGFKVDVLMEVGANFDYHVSLLNLIKRLESNSQIDQVVCSRENRSDIRLIHLDPYKYSNQIGRKLYRFIKDFNLEKQLEIINFSTAESKFDQLACAQIKFKTINAISLYFYYASDWGLSDDNTYDIDFYSRIQKSPFVSVKYSEFINQNDAEILKTYP